MSPSGGETWLQSADNMAGTGAESSCLEALVESTESKLEVTQGLQAKAHPNDVLPPARLHHLNSPNSTATQEPRVQTPETSWVISHSNHYNCEERIKNQQKPSKILDKGHRSIVSPSHCSGATRFCPFLSLALFLLMTSCFDV